MQNRSLLMCAAENKSPFYSQKSLPYFQYRKPVMISIIAHKSIVNHVNCCISGKALDDSLPSDLFNLDGGKNS